MSGCAVVSVSSAMMWGGSGDFPQWKQNCEVQSKKFSGQCCELWQEELIFERIITRLVV